MPELPEVETVVRGLARVLEGRPIDRVEVRRADLRWPVPDDLAECLEGAMVERVWRRAKYGLIGTARGTLIFHLGMSGRLRLDPEAPGKHDHVLIVAGNHCIAFHDPRRFGSLHWAGHGKEEAHRLLAGLGPEPLSDMFDTRHLAAAAAGRRVAAKSLLLDQRIVAGLGNIYVAEALFRARVAPLREAGGLTRRECGRLVKAVKAVLAEAIDAGGTTLRDYRTVSGDEGWFRVQHRVYGRAGESCAVCGSRLSSERIGGRASVWCAKCQR